MFSKGEDKDWEMRMVLMDQGMAGGRTAGCIRKQQAAEQTLVPFCDLSHIISESMLLECHYKRYMCIMIW